METHTTESGETVYVATDEAEAASIDVFYRVYQDPEGTEPYGYLCGSCGTVDNAMDTMGRIVCNECGNTRKPEEWDAAHE
jgi:hypothetical protein